LIRAVSFAAGSSRKQKGPKVQAITFLKAVLNLSISACVPTVTRT
jgi:hypothetical protein